MRMDHGIMEGIGEQSVGSPSKGSEESESLIQEYGRSNGESDHNGYDQPLECSRSQSHRPPQIYRQSNAYKKHYEHDEPINLQQPPSYEDVNGYGHPEKDIEHYGYEQPSDHRQPATYSQTQGYGQQTQPHMITSPLQIAQATPGTVVVTDEKLPPDILWKAVLAGLCCCWPAGIVAIIFACLARSETDTKKARAKYRLANIFKCISIVSGVICTILVIVFRNVCSQ